MKMLHNLTNSIFIQYLNNIQYHFYHASGTQCQHLISIIQTTMKMLHNLTNSIFIQYLNNIQYHFYHASGTQCQHLISIIQTTMKILHNLTNSIFIYVSVQAKAYFFQIKHVMDPYKLILFLKLCLYTIYLFTLGCFKT